MKSDRYSILTSILAATIIGALSVGVGLSLLACSCTMTQNVPIFVQEYHRALAALCDPNLDVLGCTVTNTSSTQYVCTLQCRDRVCAADRTLQFTIRCDAHGLIESISADRALALGEDQAYAPGTPIPIETVMYAAADTQQQMEELMDLQVKSAKAMLSYGNPDFYKAKSLAQLRAKCPTPQTTFDEITQFSFNLTGGTDSFRYVVNRAEGVISGKKRNKFKWTATSMYGTTNSPGVGLFMATLNKNMLSMMYRHKQGNKDGLLMQSNMFDSIHQSSPSNKPIRGVGFGGVTLFIDGTQHTASNVPMLFKFSRRSLGVSKFRMPKPKKPQ
jgi:hypothetical protein